jgi:hypothetical protein
MIDVRSTHINQHTRLPFTDYAYASISTTDGSTGETVSVMSNKADIELWCSHQVTPEYLHKQLAQLLDRLR